MVQTCLNSYDKPHISWFGHINVIKMDILPKWLYTFQAIPVEPSPGFSPSMNKAIHAFIWQCKKPRIWQTVLSLTKNKGGVALPQITLYFYAVYLIRILDWYHSRSYEFWTSIENDLIPVDLILFSWTNPTDEPSKVPLPTFTMATLQVWDTNLCKSLLSSRQSPMIPLFGCAPFPPTLNCLWFLSWKRCDNPPPSLTLEGGKLIPLSYILAWLEHTQLTHYLEILHPMDSLTRLYTDLESLFFQSTRSEHLLSLIYLILLKETYPNPPPFISK